MAEKKSSEILLDLDNRIQNIEKQLKLQEFQLRIIIDNFNKLFKILPTEKALPLKITEVKEVAPITNQIEVQNNKIISNKDYNPEKEKRTPITQVIKYKNGDPVGFATVLISNSNGSFTKKITTNTVGRWQAVLAPGKYVVSVFENTNPLEIIQFTQTFEVSDNTQTIILPVPESI